MKKLLTLGSIAVLSLGLSACNGSAPVTTKSPVEAGTVIEGKLMTAHSDDGNLEFVPWTEKTTMTLRNGNNEGPIVSRVDVAADGSFKFTLPAELGDLEVDDQEPFFGDIPENECEMIRPLKIDGDIDDIQVLGMYVDTKKHKGLAVSNLKNTTYKGATSISAGILIYSKNHLSASGEGICDGTLKTHYSIDIKLVPGWNVVRQMGGADATTMTTYIRETNGKLDGQWATLVYKETP